MYVLENDIVEPSTSDWSSPPVLVPRYWGVFRFCTDHIKANTLTTSASYPISQTDNCVVKPSTCLM